MNERNIIAVPDIGDFRDVEVIEVLVGPGDVVGLETPLITLETDKATMDIPATAAGRVVEVLVGKGSRVSQGDPVVSLEPAGQAAEAREAAPAAAPAETASEQAAAAVEPAASATGQVPVPDIGDFQDVEVIEVLVAVGDQIELETPLVTLETDKATMDVPSTVAGRVAAIHVAKGSRVNAGDLVVTVAGAPGARAPEGPTAVAAATATPPPAAGIGRATGRAGRRCRRATRPPIEESGFSRSYASPSVRRFARELGVDLGRVRGTGQKGRVTRDDVKSHVKAALAGRPGPAVTAGAALPAVPEVDFAAFGPVDVQPLTRIQRISGTPAARQLGERPARDAARRGRHHRHGGPARPRSRIPPRRRA